MATLNDLATTAQTAHDAYVTAQATADQAKASYATAQASADSMQKAQHSALLALIAEAQTEDAPGATTAPTPAARVR